MKRGLVISFILMYCANSISVPMIERITVHSMNDIRHFINHHTLVVLDIDNTMLYDIEEPMTGLVEPTIFPQLFRTIKKKAWGTLALTARNTTQQYQLFTLGQLNSLKLSFTQFFPYDTTHTISCILLDDYNKAYYMDGVIFVSGTNKGEALRSFLSYLPELPDTIIIIDDRSYNLDNIISVFKNETLFPELKKIILCDYPYVEQNRATFKYHFM